MLFQFFENVVRHDNGKKLLFQSLAGTTGSEALFTQLHARPLPYTELPTAKRSAASERSDVVFISARFRTGSTLLWNVFRQLPQFTAYYEPLNERRWFDPHTRGDMVDSTHRQAADYWREYNGLECLAEHYRLDWIDHHLYMDERSWAPHLKRYIEILIERAPNRPVLQFNRIDFRLPWLRKHFPQAKLIHLCRNPRDQWCSTLMDFACFGPDAPMSMFQAHDKFYLLRWACDLKYVFPFIDPSSLKHPYEVFYYIWRLSHLFGRYYADASLTFEELTRTPEQTLRKLMSCLDCVDVDISGALAIIDQPPLGRWREYANDEWFRQIELQCENTLQDFFNTTYSPQLGPQA